MKHRCCSWLTVVATMLIVVGPAWSQESARPVPPTSLSATDRPMDGGEMIDLTWDVPPDAEGIDFYRVYRSRTAEELKKAETEGKKAALSSAKAAAAEKILGDGWKERLEELPVDQRPAVRAARAAAAARVEAEWAGPDPWQFLANTKAGEHKITVDKLEPTEEYRFRVIAVAKGVESVPAETTAGVSPRLQWFNGSPTLPGGRFWLGVIVFLLCGAIIYWIQHARKGKPIRVRKIAGLEAVDEAVGRATEMGRSILFVPGIQDMNDIQTIAGITILSRVAKTAAEYDARVEVPTARSLVMTTARETVQAAFLSAGRPDAYNEDLIYYVTDEQFGYVAYLSGMMVREKPAACFYMGSFFAESLILAETGNSIGAIQIAGTAQPAQLPFFVAACDYTLIGEEFFAASAYLSGSAEELGSLKGQDVGKVIVAGFLVVGVLLYSAVMILGGDKTDEDGMMGVVNFIKDIILT